MTPYQIHLCERYRYLSKVEARFRLSTPASACKPAWSSNPRSGAKWVELESQALLAAYEESEKTAFALCKLAFAHGRSACAVEAQLIKLLKGKYTYPQ